MTQGATDDRIEAVVSLVLQAVDQRLAAVRNEIAQINNSLIHSHHEMQAQIDECRELCLSLADTVASQPNGTDTGAQQLMEVANVLTQHVATFEVRVNQYTNDRVAELRAVVDRLAATPAPTPSGPIPAVASAATVGSIAPTTPSAAARAVSNDMAPAAARLGSLAPLRATTSPAPAVSFTPAAVSPAPTIVVPTPAQAAVPVAAPAAAPPIASNGPIDLDALTAQMSARLAAVIDRALAT